MQPWMVTILVGLLSILVSAITSIIIGAFKYGKFTEKIFQMQKEIDKIEELSKVVGDINKTLYELKGMFEIYIKLQCDEIGFNKSKQ